MKWEFCHSDTAAPPGTEGGLRLNSLSVWAREVKGPQRGPWRRTGHRSSWAARKHVERHGEPEWAEAPKEQSDEAD